jgi:hypothetical protein
VTVTISVTGTRDEDLRVLCVPAFWLAPARPCPEHHTIGNFVSY